MELQVTAVVLEVTVLLEAKVMLQVTVVVLQVTAVVLEVTVLLEAKVVLEASVVDLLKLKHVALDAAVEVWEPPVIEHKK